MQLKKLSMLVACFMVSGFSTNSFASEISNYKNRFILGAKINALGMSSEYDEDDYKISNNIELNDGSFSFELDAKYKIYLGGAEQNSFFVTPEIFYSFGSVKADDTEWGLGYYNLKITPSYGAKVSVGYELRNKHAFSVGLGLQNMSYKYKHDDGINIYSKDDDELAFLFSFDYEYNINENLVFNAGLTCSYFDFKTPDNVVLYSAGRHPVAIINQIDNTTVTIGVGLGYRF